MPQRASNLVDEATYISVDVETSGPNPADYSMLAIGACVAFEPTTTFYIELQPVTDAFTPEALAVGGLDMERLRAEGVAPEQAMRRLSDWLSQTTPPGQKPVFVGFNAPFDWMFVADYFHRFLGENPFGHKALDIKALFMGATGSRWRETRYRDIAAHYRMEQAALTHNALEDALAQAALLRAVLGELTEGTRP
jgi:DNA polymerase III epsilon subunit-like protein